MTRFFQNLLYRFVGVFAGAAARVIEAEAAIHAADAQDRLLESADRVRERSPELADVRQRWAQQLASDPGSMGAAVIEAVSCDGTADAFTEPVILASATAKAPAQKKLAGPAAPKKRRGRPPKSAEG